MRLAHLVLVLPFAACVADHDAGPPPSQRNAELAFGAISNRIEAASRSLGDGRVAPLDGAVTATAPCSLGGQLGLDGTYEVTDTQTSIDLQASFASCRETDGLFDGTLHWTELVDPTQVQDELHGALDFTNDDGAFSCTFDVTWIVEASGHISYSGSICGYTVAQLDL